MKVAVAKPDGTTIDKKEDAMDALAEFWGKTFAKKEVDTETMKKFVARFVRPIEFDNAPPPDTEVLENLLKRVKDSAPEPRWRTLPCLASREEARSKSALQDSETTMQR